MWPVESEFLFCTWAFTYWTEILTHLFLFFLILWNYIGGYNFIYLFCLDVSFKFWFVIFFARKNWERLWNWTSPPLPPIKTTIKRLLNILSSILFWFTSTFYWFSGIFSYRKLVTMQMILVHGNGGIVSSECNWLLHEDRPVLQPFVNSSLHFLLPICVSLSSLLN